MESNKLYRVQEDDLPRLQKLLTVCFAYDPLYHALIPDDDTRERLLPELFPAIWRSFFTPVRSIPTAVNWTVFWWFLMKQSIIISWSTASQRRRPCLPQMAGWSKRIPAWRPSGISFRKGLPEFQLDGPASSDRTASCNLPGSDPGHQHHGLAELLMDEVIDYAQEHKMLISWKRIIPTMFPSMSISASRLMELWRNLISDWSSIVWSKKHLYKNSLFCSWIFV